MPNSYLDLIDELAKEKREPIGPAVEPTPAPIGPEVLPAPGQSIYAQILEEDQDATAPEQLSAVTLNGAGKPPPTISRGVGYSANIWIALGFYRA